MLSTRRRTRPLCYTILRYYGRATRVHVYSSDYILTILIKFDNYIVRYTDQFSSGVFGFKKTFFTTADKKMGHVHLICAL